LMPIPSLLQLKEGILYHDTLATPLDQKVGFIVTISNLGL
jgi:hypothetical protein